jgi:hypothetical protein
MYPVDEEVPMPAEAHSPIADTPEATGNEPGLLWPRLTVCVMLAVFVVACCLPAVNMNLMGSENVVEGWVCLTSGIILCFPLWSANLFFALGCLWLVAGWNTAAFLWGLAAAFIAAVCLAGPFDVLSLSSGGYLWVGDMLFLTLFAGIRSRLYGDRRVHPPEVHPLETLLLPGESMMSHDANEHDVVKVYSGDMVTVELYQQALKEAGVESKVVGLSLSASFGTAIPGSVELWVKSEDAEKANAAIKQFESEKDEPE